MKNITAGGTVDLSIIIVNWNAKEFLKGCLDSIISSESEVSYEIIFVDNASTDGSVAFVEKEYPRVQVIANRENAGFARANNSALKKASGRYLLLLNPDTVLRPDTLPVMLRFMDDNPRCGVAGCRVLNADGTLQLACRRNIPEPADAFYKLTGLSRLFPRSPRFARYNLTYSPEDKLAPVDAVSGSFLMIRKEAVEKIGLLDEQFFMYGEDLDWCLRARRAGYENYYVPFTAIVHYHGQSSKKRPLRAAYHFYQAMYLFYRKHYPARWLRPLILIGAALGFCCAAGKIILMKKFRSGSSLQKMYGKQGRAAAGRNSQEEKNVV